MARLTDEMLRRWDEDPGAGYEAGSSFTLWWARVVGRSIKASRDDYYSLCVRQLENSLYETRYSLYDVGRAPMALSGLMETMELLHRCDTRLIPDDCDTFDLQDISQMLYILIFQMDEFIAVNATPPVHARWVEELRGWYVNRCEYVETAISLSHKPLREIRSHVEYEDDYYFDALDQLTWVINMLEWYKLDDPRRNLGIELAEWQHRLAEYEAILRPSLALLRKAGLAQPNRMAPRRFWWRTAVSQ